ncbi:hypothetical protein F3K40_35355 [Streptomyces sp. LBUM 1478]|nr:hypothetical protein [Streptomyces sp. LBUM 1484]MBP5871667.1 hypothetical protein [Streptomyces sp. LBUM 1485]MBP5880131.1 hypothetical protein [Streptomyces sp. LBUM 1477]MBP5887966.1 hypothetical protein [Streptomyces sp. LBUM 1487]MBP5903978.1 hypothetical protein [Streptomyces sp. LBUM 1488]MBP5909774.1 hypothetical protein [Streptomyces sp. LBUM 1478]MBP5912335.1 hypothetical protein [Streptomyces sp. LBUM 1486]MBP5927011.1 hypothetical protein [Streptomyces sp. LBUM 1479]QTU50031.
MNETTEPTALGLPEQIRACLFDLDGDAFRPFDPSADDEVYVDGRPRAGRVSRRTWTPACCSPSRTPGRCWRCWRTRSRCACRSSR